MAPPENHPPQLGGFTPDQAGRTKCVPSDWISDAVPQTRAWFHERQWAQRRSRLHVWQAPPIWCRLFRLAVPHLTFAVRFSPEAPHKHPGVLPSVIASSYGTACLPERSERGGDDRAEARATGRVRCGPSGAQLIALPRERSRTRLHSTRSEFRTSPGLSLPMGPSKGSPEDRETPAVQTPEAQPAGLPGTFGTVRVSWWPSGRWNKVVWDGGTRFPGNYCALLMAMRYGGVRRRGGADGRSRIRAMGARILGRQDDCNGG